MSFAKVPDNVGKGTQIKHIKSWIEQNHGPVHVLHYSNIKYTPYQHVYSKKKLTASTQFSDKEKIKLESIRLYQQMFELMNYSCENEINLILDRAHIGEVVYSPMYREYDGKYVYTLEKAYCGSLELDLYQTAGFDSVAIQCVKPTWYDTLLIVYVDEAENLIKRDDGLSFSTDLDKKQQEIELFKLAYEKSCLNKILINIASKTPDQVWEETCAALERSHRLTLEKFEESFK